MQANPTFPPFQFRLTATSKRAFRGTTLAALALALAGCQNMPVNLAQAGAGNPPVTAASGGCKRLGANTNTQNAVIGAAGGAAVGAVIGSASAKTSSVGARNGALLGAMLGALAGSQYNNAVGMTEQDDGSVKMNIPGAVLFRSGSADLNPSFQQTLNQVASTIREYCGLTASVVGHTDNTGTPAGNERLSRERAEAVVAYLRSQSVDGSRLSSEGRAAREPVSTRNDENGRMQNRRVEIFIRPSAV